MLYRINTDRGVRFINFDRLDAAAFNEATGYLTLWIGGEVQQFSGSEAIAVLEKLMMMSRAIAPAPTAALQECVGDLKEAMDRFRERKGAIAPAGEV